MTEIRAIAVKSLGGVGSDDQKHGLIQFVREKADANGNTDFWVGVPVALLPHLASVAIATIPQPEGHGGHHPTVFAADEISFGTGPAGELVLTLVFDGGAAIAVQMTEGQARSLAMGLEVTIGKTEMAPAPSDRPS